MSSSLQSFQLASELPLSPSEGEDKIRVHAAPLEKLQDEGYGGSIPWPGEIRKFVEIISVLEGRIKALEQLTEKQSILIDDLRKEVKAYDREIDSVRSLSTERIDELKAEVASSRQFVERLADDIGNDRSRIKALEHPQKESEINKKRAEKIREYLAENGTPGKFLDKTTHKLVEGKAVRFELLRSYLDCDKWQLNRALRTLFQIHPGEYCKKKLNKTTWLLVERPKL